MRSVKAAPPSGQLAADRLAAVDFGDAADDGQPQAGAVLLGREERLEDSRQRSVRQARAACRRFPTRRRCGVAQAVIVSVPPSGMASMALSTMFSTARRSMSRSAATHKSAGTSMTVSTACADNCGASAAETSSISSLKQKRLQSADRGRK